MARNAIVDASNEWFIEFFSNKYVSYMIDVNDTKISFQQLMKMILESSEQERYVIRKTLVSLHAKRTNFNIYFENLAADFLSRKSWYKDEFKLVEVKNGNQ